jgi:cation:H+ antiporter
MIRILCYNEIIVITSVFLLTIGFILLWKGGDWLVDGATGIGLHFTIPKAILGLSLVAFGTSAPELVVSIFATLNDQPDLIIGNILGSNIANTLLILGVMCVITPVVLNKMSIKKELWFNIIASFSIFIVTFIPASYPLTINRWEAGALLIGFHLFLFFLFRSANTEETAEMLIGHDPEATASTPIQKSTLLFIGGIILLPIAGHFVVEGASQMALSFGLSQSLVGLLAVALGTSLPEMVTSVIAALKKEPELAVGNIIGSNIFNIFLILGISGLMSPLVVQGFLVVDIFVVMLISLIVLSAFFISSKGLRAFHGACFLIGYIVYCGIVFLRG